MSDEEPHVMVQKVEYLGLAEGLVGSPPEQQSIVIITIRPDLPRFSPHNIAVTKEQAWRLFADLQNILVPFVLLVSITTAAGCGARVEIESAKWDSLSGERARTQVEVDVLQTQRPEQIAEREEKKPSVEAEEKSVIGSGNTLIIVNIREGDTHNQTNIHIHEAAPQRTEERVTIRREVQVEPRRQVDERCEFLKKQHEERVEIWRKYPLGH